MNFDVCFLKSSNFFSSQSSSSFSPFHVAGKEGERKGMRRAPCPSFFNRGRCIVARRHTCISDKFLPNTFFIFFLKGISRVAPKLKQVVAVIPLSALRPDPRSRTEAAAGVRSTFPPPPPPLTHFDARTGPPSFLRRRTTGAAAVRTFVRTCLIVPCYATHGRGGREAAVRIFPSSSLFVPFFLVATRCSALLASVA